MNYSMMTKTAIVAALVVIFYPKARLTDCYNQITNEMKNG